MRVFIEKDVSYNSNPTLSGTATVALHHCLTVRLATALVLFWMIVMLNFSQDVRKGRKAKTQKQNQKQNKKQNENMYHAVLKPGTLYHLQFVAA